MQRPQGLDPTSLGARVPRGEACGWVEMGRSEQPPLKPAGGSPLRDTASSTHSLPWPGEHPSPATRKAWTWVGVQNEEAMATRHWQPFLSDSLAMRLEPGLGTRGAATSELLL